MHCPRCDGGFANSFLLIFHRVECDRTSPEQQEKPLVKNAFARDRDEIRAMLDRERSAFEDEREAQFRLDLHVALAFHQGHDLNNNSFDLEKWRVENRDAVEQLKHVPNPYA